MLVSAIMPTRGRAQFARKAVECFLSQTWPSRELVIVDDEDAPSFDVAPEYEAVRYHRLPLRLSIGAKRNVAVSRSAGDVIIHFDDDDWSAPQRMEDQVMRLAESKAELTGYHTMLFEDDAGGRWRFFNGNHRYALGTSLCYTRDFWRSHPFPDLNEGEDNAIVFRAPRIVSVDAGELMIARMHSGNTSDKRKNLHKECWRAA